MAKKVHGRAKFEKIKTDCVRVNREKRRPDFFQVDLNLYEGVITMLENHPCLLCGRDLTNK